MKIAIIGSGNLGLSIAKGLVYNNTYTSLYLTKRDLSEIKKWEEYNNVKITTNNQEATGTYAWADPDQELIFVFLSNRTYPSMSNNLLGKKNVRTRMQAIVYKALIY